MIYSIREKGEGFENFFRRFKQRIISSKNIDRLKERRFRVPKISKNQLRKRAVKHSEILAKKDYMIRTGKISPEELYK